MASGSQSVYSIENENFFRFTKLLLDLGTEILREVLKSYFFPKWTFDQYLQFPVESHRISILIRKRVLTQEQILLLYPASGAPNIMDLDLSVLYTLIRNLHSSKNDNDLCWINPQARDHSWEADVTRIKEARNLLHGHMASSKLPDTLFKNKSKELEDCYLRITTKRKLPMTTADLLAKIDKIKTESIDVRQRKDLIGRLEVLCDMDVSKAVETIQDEYVREIRSNLKDEKSVMHMIQKLLLRVSNSSVLRERMNQRIRETESMLKLQEIEFERYGILPASYQKALDVLRKRKCVFLTGRAGSGKTFMAKALLRKLCQTKQQSAPDDDEDASTEEMKPLFISNVAEWRELVDTDRRVCVYVDDFLGRYGLQESDLNAWGALADILLSVLLQGNVYIIMTLRSNIWEKVACEQKTSSFSSDSLERFLNRECLIDLSSAENSLSYEEKQLMIQRYKEADNVEIGDDTMKHICNTTDSAGFPQSCKLMKTATAKDTFQVFAQRDEFLLHEIKTLFNSNIKLYAAIAVIALFGGKMSTEQFRTDSNVVKCVLESLEVQIHSLLDFETLLKPVIDTFLTYIQEDKCVYLFSHDTVHAVVLKSFGDKFPELTLKLCSLDILSKVCYAGNETEGVCTVSDSWGKLYVKNDYFGIISKRFLDELSDTRYSAEKQTFKAVAEALIWKSNDFITYVFDEGNGFQIITELLDANGATLLVHASAVGNVKLIKACLKIGPKSKFQLQLKEALLSACDSKKRAIVTILVKEIQQIPDEAMFAAAKAGDVEVLEILHNAGGNIDCKRLSTTHSADLIFDLESDTTCLLDLACLYGREEMVTFLADQDKFNFSPDENKTSCVFAAAGGNIKVLEVLTQCGLLDGEDEQQTSTMLTMACFYSRREMVDHLLKFFPNSLDCDYEIPPVCAAAAGSDIKLLKFLIEYGGTFNVEDESGETISHYACKAGRTNTLDYIRRIYPDLLYNNARSLLHIAAKMGNTDILQFLTNYNVDPTLEDGDGQTILHVACEKSDAKLVQYIFQLKECCQLIQALLPDIDETMLEVFVDNGFDPFEHIDDEYGDNILNLACYYGETSAVTLLLKSYPSLIDTANNYGQMPIHYAVIGGHVEILKTLVKLGSDPTATDDNGNNIAHFSIGDGEEVNETMVKYVARTYPQLFKKVNEDGLTALHSVAEEVSLEMMTYLLEECHLDHSVVIKGLNILHVACLYNKTQLIKYLVHTYPDLAVKDNHGYTMAHMAVLGGHVGALKYLLHLGFSPMEKDGNGNNILHAAAVARGERSGFMVRYLVTKFPGLKNEVSNEGQTPEQLAKSLGRKYITTCFNKPLQAKDYDKKYKETEDKSLEHHDDDDDDDDDDATDSFKLEEENGFDVFSACSSRHENEVQHIIQLNPFILNERDVDGKTLLHHAAEGGNVKVLKLLLQYDIDYNVKDKRNRTILHAACERASTEIVSYIATTCRTILEEREGNGQNAVHIASQRGDLEMFESLMQSGIDPTLVDGKGRNILHLACLRGKQFMVKYILKNYPALRHDVDTNGETAIHYAGRGGDVSIIQLLEKSGLNPKKLSSYNCSALHVSVETGKQHTARYLMDRYPNLVHSRDQSGWYPIHSAASFGQLLIFEELISREADPNVKTKKGETALELAEQRNHREIIEKLLTF